MTIHVIGKKKGAVSRGWRSGVLRLTLAVVILGLLLAGTRLLWGGGVPSTSDRSQAAQSLPPLYPEPVGESPGSTSSSVVRKDGNQDKPDPSAKPPGSSLAARRAAVTALVSMPRLHGVGCKEVRENTGPGDLQILCSFLSEGEHTASWRTIVWMIGFIGTEGDGAVATLRDYLTRKETRCPGMWDLAFGKTQALLGLGLIGGQEAENVLRQAFTPEGARDLTKAWSAEDLGGQQREDPDWIVVHTRGNAAQGLVYTCQPEDTKAVEDLYNELDERMSHNPHFQGNFADNAGKLSVEEQRDDVLYGYLVSAMAIKDLIAEVGMPAYRDMLGTDEERAALRPYLGQRSFRRRNGSPSS